MAIKKVVLTKSEVIEKYPEFDNNKIYVSYLFKDNTHILQYKFINNKIKLFGLSNRDNTNYDTYNNWEDFFKRNKSLKVYILNNMEEYARFILGCKEFEILKPIKEMIELPEDEVSIEDVNIDNIYAFKDKYGVKIIQQDTFNSTSYSWTLLDVNHGKNFSYNHGNLKEQILYQITGKNDIHGKYDVYEFSGNNKQEEFFKWSLEQITGKKFEKVEEGLYLFGKNEDAEIFGVKEN